MKIFISYRRDDSAGYAGRLFDYLSAHFGAENVFMDIDTIEPGEDFRKVVSRAMGTCDVVLVMIGKQWLNISDAGGGRRLDDPRDLVRMEVGAALSNRRVRVIPVLVRDAPMPGEHELPEGLKELTWRNAFELSDSRFQIDARRLIGVIERIGGKTPTPTGQPAPAPRKEAQSNRSRNLLLIGGGTAFAVLALLIWIFRSSLIGMAAPPSATPEATAAIVSTTTTPPPAPTETITVIPSQTASPEPSPTATLTPQDVPGLVVQLVDDYFTCVNDARQDVRADFERCWNMLSDQPGEFQDYLNTNSGGFESFYIDYWNKYKVSYALYYCPSQGQHFVDARFWHRDRSNPSIIRTEQNLLEFRFAADDDGWRITGAKPLGSTIGSDISSYCETQPRVDKLGIFQ